MLNELVDTSHESVGHLTEVLSNNAPPVIPDNLRRRESPSGPGVAGGLKYPNRRLQSVERSNLVARYRAGALLYELAVEFGIDVQTVKRQLKQADVELRPWPALSEAQALKIVGEYLKTEIPIAKLAERYGVGYGTVRRVFEAQGVKARPRGRWSRS